MSNVNQQFTPPVMRSRQILLFNPNDTCSKAEVVVYDRSKAACIKHPPCRMLWASLVKAPWNALSHTNSCYAFDCHTY
ncbi:unnamed protein product [Arctia plantaginis]|uniref:Uncharacterized protein n=1 Tax=Arctia plantaginis TaxID=874455 RepID=A0A8S0ZLB3_ARCPL|nr:unnamed protein product [Arctia plantaginis]